MTNAARIAEGKSLQDDGGGRKYTLRDCNACYHADEDERIARGLPRQYHQVICGKSNTCRLCPEAFEGVAARSYAAAQLRHAAVCPGKVPAPAPVSEDSYPPQDFRRFGHCDDSGKTRILQGAPPDDGVGSAGNAASINLPHGSIKTCAFPHARMAALKNMSAGSAFWHEEVASGLCVAAAAMPAPDPSGAAVVETKASLSIDKLLAGECTYDELLDLPLSQHESDMEAAIAAGDYTRAEALQTEMKEKQMSIRNPPVIFAEA